MKKITQQAIASLIAENKTELCSTHSKLCLPIINRIYKKMSAGIKFPGIKVHNNLIGDGHHRYLASLLANYTIEIIPTNISSATTPIDWNSVVFEEDDWDTEAKISMLNQQDANYNNMPIEDVIELTK